MGSPQYAAGVMIRPDPSQVGAVAVNHPKKHKPIDTDNDHKNSYSPLLTMINHY